MAITLRPSLQTKLDQIARRLGKSPEEIADEAIRAHLEELDMDALEEEMQAYERLYPELRQQYVGQIVAISTGRVVDADSDFEALFLRVQQQHGDRPVPFRRVGDTAVEEYRFRSPRLG
jgi:predicted DNA-binding protein